MSDSLRRPRPAASRPFDVGENPVHVSFCVDDGDIVAMEFKDHDWHEVTLKLPHRPFAGLAITCSRTWIPEPEAPKEMQRELGVGISFR